MVGELVGHESALPFKIILLSVRRDSAIAELVFGCITRFSEVGVDVVQSGTSRRSYAGDDPLVGPSTESFVGGSDAFACVFVRDIDTHPLM